MIKVHIQTVCEFCDGEAYEPIRTPRDFEGQPVIRHQRCAYCQGKGRREKRVKLDSFIEMLTTVALADPMEPDWPKLAQEKVTSRYQDSRDAIGM